MIVGDPRSFAIESSITLAFPKLSQRALGYFLIHIGGNQHGEKRRDASMLACSFDGVGERLARRGMHEMRCVSDVGAALIVRAFLDANFDNEPRDSYFGLAPSAFKAAVQDSNVQWAPDGDAAFDDGSYVLQFDVDDRVRLIGFQNKTYPADTHRSVSEQWIDSDLFYGILSRWRELFTGEWSSSLLKDRAGTKPQ